jgi:hypothetical protein
MMDWDKLRIFHAVAEAGDEDRHEGEAADLDQDRQAHRDAQAQLRAQRLAVGPIQAAADERERRVERVAAQYPQRSAGLQPHHDRGRDAAAEHAECGQPDRRPAEHEQRGQRHLQRQSAELQRHHRLRPRDRDVEAAVGLHQQCAGQGECQRQQVAAQLVLDVGWGLRDGEEGLRKGQHQRAQRGQRQRQPSGLVQLATGLRVLAGAEELADDRPEREHDPHQADEDGHVSGGTDRQRREVVTREAGDEQGVDRRVADDRELADEHRPGQGPDAPQVRGAGAAQAPAPKRPGSGWSSPEAWRARSA